MKDDELYAWLRLSLEPGVGIIKTQQLLTVFGLPQQIFDASFQQLNAVVSDNLARQLAGPVSAIIQEQIEKTFTWLQGTQQGGILTLADTAYPQALLDIYDPPPLIYYDGNLAALNKPLLAIVGARAPTLIGEVNAEAFANYLATHGWGVVSGLASGIDAFAHQGALNSHQELPTIAVMGTGIDRIYPAQNKNLAVKIREQGLLLSEFPLGTASKKHHFPKRNRIVAGLSLGVLVVEASLKSGSLITAKLAGETGREIYAIPGSIHSPQAKGCHYLIKQGAKLVESAQDIEEELLSKTQHLKSHLIKTSNHLETTANEPSLDAILQGLNKQEQQLIKKMAYEAWSLDELSSRLKITSQSIATLLTSLELEGLVQRLSDGRFQVVIKPSQ